MKNGSQSTERDRTAQQQPPDGAAPVTVKSTAPVDKAVFLGASIALAVMVALAAALPNATDAFFDTLLASIVRNASWYYVLVVAVILVSTLMIALSSYGDIKLGPNHAEPEYSFVSWFAMLFAAGMGIGLMFFGVAEPVMHFLSPPRGEAASIDAAREAMRLTYFHWGLHAWAIYAVVALILGYFAYRHDLPLTLRSALYPLIGERIYGPIGTTVDAFAIICTVFGVATSLGFGVEQINSGLAYLFGIPKNQWVQTLLVLGTTSIATLSVVAGLDVGVRRLSELNIALAIMLLLGILALGPTVLLLQAFMQNLGGYLSEIVTKTFNLYAYEPTDWLGGWTIFYWGWWMSWAPFVGLFIARISRGRTLREFVLGALLGPTLFTLLWMTVFGNTAIDRILNKGESALGQAVQQDASVALFRFLEPLPFSDLLSMLAIAMVLVFFVTSADSGAMVLNMLSSHGRDDTPRHRRVYWMAVIGVSALVLMYAGGLGALQTAAIASALPFSLALLAALWGLTKALHEDQTRRQAAMMTTLTPPNENAGSDWKERLANLLSRYTPAQVERYQHEVVLPAMREFAEGLQQHGVRAEIREHIDGQGKVSLHVHEDSDYDFVYEVRRGTSTSVPNTPAQADAPSERAEVHLSEGGQDYCIMGWSREQVRLDMLEQFGKHRHFLSLLRQ